MKEKKRRERSGVFALFPVGQSGVISLPSPLIHNKRSIVLKERERGSKSKGWGYSAVKGINPSLQNSII